MDQYKNVHMPLRKSDDGADSFLISDTKDNITGYEEEEGYSAEE